MPNSKKMKEILDKIEIEKELLSAMPKNNQKNIDKYLKKTEQLSKEYEEIQNNILQIFNKKYNQFINIEESSDIENLQKRIETIENVLYLLNDVKTSYEKMELDKIIYKIGRYYKGNLEDINEQIELALKKFSSVGIELELKDFDYSTYVNQYMEVFFEQIRRRDSDASRLKAKFEEVYWKCPDIIIHIELNIRNLYLKNQQQIDKYFEKEKIKILKQWNKTPKEIMKSFYGIEIQKNEKMLQDKKSLIMSLLEGKDNIKEYTDDKIKSNYAKILSVEMMNNIEKRQNEIEKEIINFLNSLYEYKNYINYNFIIEDVKKHYRERENYKKIYEETKKKIDINEKKLKKLNKKGKNGFGKKKKEIKQTAEQNQLILEIKNLYKELDLNKFYNKIYTHLEESSTIYEVLNLANSYYNYLTNCIIINKKTITQEEIDEHIKGLDKFLKNPFNNIINNLTILETKDVAMVIKDRYKLLNFNVEKEDLDINNIDSLILILENIRKSFSLKKMGIEVQNIEEIMEIRKILKIK